MSDAKQPTVLPLTADAVDLSGRWCSAVIDQLAAALSKAQGAMRPAVKDSLNPHFGNNYADLASVLDACREVLAANGLSVTQMPGGSGKEVQLTTMLMHSSGQFINSTLTMAARDASPQAVGSTLTYARRYALAAVLGIAQVDDDAEAGTHSPEQERRSEATSSKPRPPMPRK